MASEVVAMAQETVLTHHLTKGDSLIVTVSSLAAANGLVLVSTLAGMLFEERIPRLYKATYRNIQGVPLDYTGEALENYVSDGRDPCSSASHQIISENGRRCHLGVQAWFLSTSPGVSWFHQLLRRRVHWICNTLLQVPETW